MANNNEKQSDINLLKASFCRQHFPDLLQFLSDFDISQIEGKAAKNTLNMNFLLQAYDHRDEPKVAKGNMSDENYAKKLNDQHQKHIKDTIDIKAACKWHFDNIDEAKLLLAIEEYFEIVSTQSDVNDATNILLKNINTTQKAKKLFPIRENQEETEIYKFEDNTTITIFEYFGITIKDKKLGIQKSKFAQFILDSSGKTFKKEEKSKENVTGGDTTFPQSVYKAIPEAQFIEAFRLYVAVRNWSEHKHNFLQRGDYAFLLYKYIIFTQIGLVYICQRLWDNPSSCNNLKEKYIKQEPIKIIEDVDLNIKIEGNKKGDVISDCSWAVGGGEAIPIEDALPQRKVEFTKKIKRYQEFKISYKYNGKQNDDVHGLLNYYTWNPTLNILVKPPHEVSYTLEDIAGEDEETEKYLSEIFTKCIETYFDRKASKSEKEKCNEALNKLGEIEPNIKELQELLGKVDKDAEQRKRDIHELIIPQLKGIDSALDEIKSGVYRSFELVRNNGRVSWLIFTVICLALFGFCAITNIFSLLKSPIVFSLIASLLILFLYFALFYIIKLQSPFKCLYGKTAKEKQLVYFITILIMVFLVVFFFISIISCRDYYIKGYNFANNKPQTNQEVANLMVSILESNPDDENTRIKLTRYYLDYANDAEKALAIASPMLDDIDKHSSGILAIIEALYSQGKDFWKVRDLLESYKKTIDCDSNVVNRIEGIMNVWGQGQTSNINKGFSLLRLSADNGDIEAQYYLGYALSHEMTDWEKSKLSGHVETSEFDLITSIEYLRKAAIYKPKAALELGRLYADLNVRDSAEVYLNKARLHSSGELYKESLYRLGLLYEGTDEGNQFIKKAAFLDYVPAILYKANKEDDHKSAIELYNSLDGYHGYRYILPIAFHHLALGQRNKALKALQDGRPFGKFDMNFIVGIDSIMHSYDDAQQAKSQADSLLKEHWNLLAKKDSTAAMKYIMESAKQGCLYAEMICVFRDAERNGTSDRQAFRLTEIGEEIPFAYVLLSYLAHKEERFMSLGFPFSDYFANQAIGKGHPAGRLMLDVPSYYLDYIQKSISNKGFAAYQYNIRQRALRINKNKRLNIIYSYKAEKTITDNKLEAKSYNFWDYVSRANNVDLHELNMDPIVFPEISDIELLNEFSDKIIDNKQETPFIK